MPTRVERGACTMRVLAAVGLPTRAPSRATTLTSTRPRRVAARCVRSNDDDADGGVTRRVPRSAVDDDDASSSSSASAATAVSVAAAGALAPATAAVAAVDGLASHVPGIDGDAAIAAAGVVALIAAAGVASRSANTDGSVRRNRATSIPGATPNLRTTGAFDDTRGRNYLIAPPPLFPLVPAFARRTFR